MTFKYLRSLLMKSAQIQHAIEREYTARRPDWIRVLHLKKLRLIIKDKLYRLGLMPGNTLQLAPATLRVPAQRRRSTHNAN